MLVLSKKNADADKLFSPKGESFKSHAENKIRKLSQILAPDVNYKLAIADLPDENDVLIAMGTNVPPLLVFNRTSLIHILPREDILLAYIAHELGHVIAGLKPGLIQYFIGELRADRVAIGLLKRAGFSRILLVKIILLRLSKLIRGRHKTCSLVLSIFLNILRLLNTLYPI